MSKSIEVRNLYRSFGTVSVLSGLQFSVPAGSVAGFIGENGAGKTTTMKIISSLDLPDSGDVQLGGLDLIQHVEELRPCIGWMPDSYDKYPLMSVFEYLDFFARSYGLVGKKRTARLHEVIEFTELGSLRDRFIDVLSKGQSQRLSLARTLLNDPEILVLDEPAAGLDPKARVEFKHLVRILAEAGKTFLISSHILSELEDMCDMLIFLKDGKVLHQGSAAELKQGTQVGSILDVHICGNTAAFSEWITMQPGLSIIEALKDGLRIRTESVQPSDIALILKRMITDGIEVSEFRKHERRLEDAFIELVSQKKELL